MIHTGKNPFACSVCDRRFTENRCLQRHKVIHRGGELYACMFCRTTFKTSEAIINHCEKEHPATSQVQNGNMSAASGSTSIDFNNREGSTEHELNGFNEASADETYPNALDILIRSVNLSIYPPINEDMVEKEVELSQTDKESSDIVGQEPEQVVANGNESIDSSQNSQDCESTVKERIAPAVNEYKRKLRDRSSLIEKKTIKGAEIAISSPTSIDSQKANKASRSMRIESSKSAKLFQCDDCEKTFKYKSNLEEHERSHTGEKPLSCSICEERFSRRFHLNRHQTKHTGEKPVLCSLCDMRFNRNDNLKRHLLTHSGEKRKRPHQCSICKKTFGRSYHLKRHILVHTGSLANVSASIDSSILVDSTEKESNASDGNNTNISTGDDLAPTRSPTSAIHSSLIKKEVKKDPKRKTILKEESSNKVHIKAEPKKSRKKDAEMKPAFTELVDNEDDIPVDEDTSEYMEDFSEYMENSISFKLGQNPESLSNEFPDTSEYMENSISFKLDQNPESSSNEPVVISPYVCISCKMEFVEEDGLDEHNRDTHSVSEHTDTRTEDIDKKNADLEQKPSLPNVTVQTGSEEIEEASVECNAVTATDRNCLSVSKEDGVDASQIASELSLPTNIPNLEPDPPVKGQKIRYKKGSIEEEIERMATAHPDNLYLVWSEKFSLDLALAVANNKPNCVLIVKNFSSNSMIGVTNMVETFSTSVVKIEPDPYSLRFFLFGRMVLPDKIRDNGRFKSVGKLESTMRKFIQAQGKKLVNVLKFSPGVNGWFETLKRDLKEDQVIADTL